MDNNASYEDFLKLVLTSETKQENQTVLTAGIRTAKISIFKIST